MSPVARWLRWGLPALFAALVAHAAWDKSPTWDEPGYLGLGAYLLEHGRWDVPGAGSHPPLAYYVQGLPFYLAYPLDDGDWSYAEDTVRDLSFVRSADVVRGNAILLDPRYDGHRLLWWVRLTGLLPAALLLTTGWRWSRALHGEAGATVSLACACLSPNLLAHAGLVTTDFTLAATYATAFLGLRHLLVAPSAGRAVAAGALGGLALASKLSALVWGPTTAVLLALAAAAAPDGVRRRLASWGPAGPPWARPWLGALVLGLVLAVVSLAVVWILYGFRAAPYLTVLRSQLWDLSSGHEAYLLGRFSTGGWWYYFPVVLLVKTPLALQALAAAGAGILVARRDRRWEAALLLLPPALFLAAFVQSEGKALGLRYLLPLFPFACIAAGAAARGWDGLPRWRRRAVAGLCAVLALTAARIHPDHLAFFNELAGGPDGGHRVAVDSNLDWGQDLRGLKGWMDGQGLARIRLSYFGTVDPALYGLDYDWLPSYLLPQRGDVATALPVRGWIAISVTNRVGVYMDRWGHGKDLYRWLDAYEPVARIGHSIWVYHVP